MIEKRMLSAKSKKKDLDDKFLVCSSLPDPEDEKDLTTFITLWVEESDKSMAEALENSQTAEDVVKKLQTILGEAMSQYDYAKIKWCEDYMERLRTVIVNKFDKVSANVFSYIDKYIKYTDEELEELKNDPKFRNKKMSNPYEKSEFDLKNNSDDLNFGIWANISGKSCR